MTFFPQPNLGVGKHYILGNKNIKISYRCSELCYYLIKIFLMVLSNLIHDSCFQFMHHFCSGLERLNLICDINDQTNQPFRLDRP